MVLVFFVYGLAFFTMGFAIALESRQSSGLRLAASLPFLAAFGLLHSLVEWADMWLLVEAAAVPTFNLYTVRLVRTLLLGISTGALLQFGSDLLRSDPGVREPAWELTTKARRQEEGKKQDQPFSLLASRISPSLPGALVSWWLPNRARPLRFLPLVLGIAWAASLALLSVPYPPGSRQWLVHADIWARYFLYLPGSLLAGFGLISHARLLEKTDFPQIARDARFAAATFLLNALVAGLVVPPGQHLPAIAMDYDSFQALFGVPVQILRAAFALAIAYFILRVLRVFRIESARQMEMANQRRLQAQQEAKLAPLEERERIAREMHDGLAQVLGFLAIKTRVVRQSVEAGKLDQARSQLELMQETLREAYADVRQSILSLRTATELDHGLLPAIRESASDFTEQNSIPVELALEEGGEVSFPPEAEVQLVRIVQEALANVRKHARATRVGIRLVRRDGEAILAVEDDGVGFDLSQVAGKKRRCFGLETMRERAESIGAALDVIPVPGAGTVIQVRFPIERAPQDPAG